MTLQPASRPINGKRSRSKPATKIEPAETPVQFDIKIDTHALTFGDIEMAMQFENGDVPVAQVIPFLNRVVVGGVRHLPLDAMPAIMEALTDAFSEMGNQKN